MLSKFLRTRLAAKLANHIPPQQFGRYLMVGICNTAFGYGNYALLTALLTPRVPFGYMLATVLSYPVNITFSYFNYKKFVFKTKGNYLREWLRCMVVYAGGMLIGLALLPVLVFSIRRLEPHLDHAAPYIAGAILLGINVVISFLGHKHFSFSGSKPSDEQPQGCTPAAR